MFQAVSLAFISVFLFQWSHLANAGTVDGVSRAPLTPLSSEPGVTVRPRGSGSGCVDILERIQATLAKIVEDRASAVVKDHHAQLELVALLREILPAGIWVSQLFNPLDETLFANVVRQETRAAEAAPLPPGHNNLEFGVYFYPSFARAGENYKPGAKYFFGIHQNDVGTNLQIVLHGLTTEVDAHVKSFTGMSMVLFRAGREGGVVTRLIINFSKPVRSTQQPDQGLKFKMYDPDWAQDVHSIALTSEPFLGNEEAAKKLETELTPALYFINYLGSGEDPRSGRTPRVPHQLSSPGIPRRLSGSGRGYAI